MPSNLTLPYEELTFSFYIVTPFCADKGLDFNNDFVSYLIICKFLLLLHPTGAKVTLIIQSVLSSVVPTTIISPRSGYLTFLPGTTHHKYCTTQANN